MILYHPESDCLFAGDIAHYPSENLVPVDPTTLPAGTVIGTSLQRPSTVLPSMDFETYSEAGFLFEPQEAKVGEWVPAYKVKGAGSQGKGGLPVVGTAAYAEHHTTEILSLSYDLKDGKGRRRWIPGAPSPYDLIEHIRRGGLIAAWNIPFEFYIWNLKAVSMYGWPPLSLEQCRCDMAKSRRYSLPGSLDAAAEVLGTPRKDSKGKALLQKLSRPHTPTKNRSTHRWTPATAWPDFCALYDYNDGDVVAEDHAAAHTPDLCPQELAVWRMDQTINWRGVQVDTVALDAALSILEQAEAKYTMELQDLTQGQVNSVSEVARLGDWVAARGVKMDDMTSESVRGRLQKIRWALNIETVPDDLHPVDYIVIEELRALPEIKAVYRALEIREALSSANVKKLRKLKQQVSYDGRLRNQYMYCGADRTGRWSSAAADDDASNSQLQNITAKGPATASCEGCGQIFGYLVNKNSCPRCGAWMIKKLKEWDIQAVEQAIADIKSMDLNGIEYIWGAPVTLLCGCLRGMFIAKEGHRLVCCDFSAIEAVAAACLSRCQWRIDVFSTHGLIYEQSAANATGIPFDEIVQYKKKNGTHHPARKGVGKIRELAGGYGGWISAWKNFGADDYFSSDEEIKQDVLKWRAESQEIVDMWGGQFVWCGPGKWDYRPELYGLEGCAINAIQNPGKCFSYHDITYGVADDILFCRLPSGRYLHYHKPRLTPAIDKLKRGPCWQISFEGYNSNSQKGPVGWGRWETFGGRLFENVVQAVSRDIQAEALLRCEAKGYSIVMHTHDEGCAEVPLTFGSVKEMCAIMSERPSWANWWPLKAAGWEHKRYQKD